MQIVEAVDVSLPELAQAVEKARMNAETILTAVTAHRELGQLCDRDAARPASYAATARLAMSIPITFSRRCRDLNANAFVSAIE